MNILVLNAGSSSLKYELFAMQHEEVALAEGKVERIGFDSAILTHQPKGKPDIREVAEILDHKEAIRKVIHHVTHPEHGALPSMDRIHAVGHRVVHGGESFSESVLVDDEIKKEIKQLFDLAPLHNPPGLTGILAVEAVLPHVPQAVVFDTAFHQSMPPTAYLYPIPGVLYRRHKVRRYGFHGTSHYYVSRKAADFLNQPVEDLRMVTCHIGNGASCTAIQGGRSIDTSMGMTPLEGLMMGTRSGDLDPALVPYIMAKEELSLAEVTSMLNKHSGLYAVSGLSSDMREIEEAMAEGDSRAALAFDMYTYRIRKYVGAYAAAMNGMDVLVFTAGVGENSMRLRQAVCEGLTFLGLELDETRNAAAERGERRIGKNTSKVEVLVIPTDEELVIARDTYALVRHTNP